MSPVTTFDTFSHEIVDVAAGTVFVRRAGRGPAVLLLPGCPETSLAWRKVAPELANEFTVIAADLPGYGDSILSDEALDDGRISKPTMARAARRERTVAHLPKQTRTALGREGAKAAKKKRRGRR
jgi:pimeloyl-ACP methyl ester carboxylesterase